MNSALISATDICFARSGRHILRNASIAVAPGELVTLIGPNGAGKSTLIRVLLGLQKPDSGSVTKRDDLVMGYMPQKLTVDPSLPLNVNRFLALTGGAKQDITTALNQTGAAHLHQHRVHSLSGGEWQRVLLARALMRKPQLLVLDEPVQGVDVAGQAALYQLIQQIRQQTGCGVLMVSHDLHLVMASTDRVVCLNQHVCCEGHPDHVSSDPAYLQLFGEPKDSRIAIYTHHHDHTHDDHEHCDHHPHEKQP